MPKGHGCLHLPSSLFQVCCHLRQGRYQQPPVLPLTQPELPDLESFFYPQKFWRSPPAPAGSTECSAHACVNCSGYGDASRTSCVCAEEWKHAGRYFSPVHGLKYGDGAQSTKNILPDFKLRGTQLGQQTLKTLEHLFLLPKQSHTPKIHISCEYIGLIK